LAARTATGTEKRHTHHNTMIGDAAGYQMRLSSTHGGEGGRRGGIRRI
jgi:hypothetical protein